VYLTNDHALGGRVNVLKYSRHKSAESWMLAKLTHPNVVSLVSTVLSERPGEHGLIWSTAVNQLAFPAYLSTLSLTGWLNLR